MPEVIRVLVIENQDTVHRALLLFFRAFPDLRLVAKVRTCREAIKLCAVHRPHVVLIDLQTLEAGGHEGVGRLRAAHPRIHLVGLTNSTSQTQRSEAFAAGIEDVIIKDASIDTLAMAIRHAVDAEPIASGR